MSKKGRIRNKARRLAAPPQPNPKLPAEVTALLTTFATLDADPSITGPDLTPDTWRWATYGMARRSLLAGYENHNHPIKLGEVSVAPAFVVEAFEHYQLRNGNTPVGTGTASPPQEWQSALEHPERIAIVTHFLRRSADITNPLGDPAMQQWIEDFTKALEAEPLDVFATIASYLTGMEHPRLFLLSGPVFAPHSTAMGLRERMLQHAAGESTTFDL